ncbi:hypothetical protein KALB_7663 [Kutzneria albida DSM 43870]|uniref:Crp/Fnr family transcriptional regulator n=1 Tax=Kutzneria albida DSM 43870 TaxID=1449976 RepID=W5WJV2_9PSEU|nr:hypothetical protein KALB_7663 [Kutzneria albida DSM 43870]
MLAQLSPAASTEFLALGTARVVTANTVLLHEGERSNHVLLLVNGCVKVTAAAQDGRVALLAIRVGGDLVGELGSLDDQPRSATVTTVGKVWLRVITQASFHEFLARRSDAALAISKSVATKLRWATRRRVDFSGCEVRVRLARVLVELAEGYGRTTSDGVVIGVSLTQPELAALVGAAEPTVHKALAALRHDEVLSTGYRRTTIRDYPALRAMAGVDLAS